MQGKKSVNTKLVLLLITLVLLAWPIKVAETSSTTAVDAANSITIELPSITIELPSGDKILVNEKSFAGMELVFDPDEYEMSWNSKLISVLPTAPENKNLLYFSDTSSYAGGPGILKITKKTSSTSLFTNKFVFITFGYSTTNGIHSPPMALGHLKQDALFTKGKTIYVKSTQKQPVAVTFNLHLANTKSCTPKETDNDCTKKFDCTKLKDDPAAYLQVTFNPDFVECDGALAFSEDGTIEGKCLNDKELKMDVSLWGLKNPYSDKIVVLEEETAERLVINKNNKAIQVFPFVTNYLCPIKESTPSNYDFGYYAGAGGTLENKNFRPVVNNVWFNPLYFYSATFLAQNVLFFNNVRYESLGSPDIFSCSGNCKAGTEFEFSNKGIITLGLTGAPREIFYYLGEGNWWEAQHFAAQIYVPQKTLDYDIPFSKITFDYNNVILKTTLDYFENNNLANNFITKRSFVSSGYFEYSESSESSDRGVATLSSSSPQKLEMETFAKSQKLYSVSAMLDKNVKLTETVENNKLVISGLGRTNGWNDQKSYAIPTVYTYDLSGTLTSEMTFDNKAPCGKITFDKTGAFVKAESCQPIIYLTSYCDPKAVNKYVFFSNKPVSVGAAGVKETLIQIGTEREGSNLPIVINAAMLQRDTTIGPGLKNHQYLKLFQGKDIDSTKIISNNARAVASELVLSAEITKDKLSKQDKPSIRMAEVRSSPASTSRPKGTPISGSTSSNSFVIIDQKTITTPWAKNGLKVSVEGIPSKTSAVAGSKPTSVPKSKSTRVPVPTLIYR